MVPVAYRWQRAAVGGLLLLGLALRLWYLHVNQLDPAYSSTDDGDYYQRALRLALTGEYVDDFWFIRSPLHVLLFGGLLRLGMLLGTIDGVLLIRLVQIALSLLAVLVGYDLGRRLFQPRAGVLFAAVLAAWFPLVELPIHLFSEPLFLYLLLIHLWLLLLWRDTRRWYLLALAGGMLGLTALARSPAVYSVPFVALWLLLEHARSVETSSRKDWLRALLAPAALRRVALFGLACGLAIAPWTIRNYQEYQQFILIDTVGPVNMWLIVGDHERRGSEILLSMPQGERQAFATREVRRLWQEDPQRFWGLLWYKADQNFQRIWQPQFTQDFFNQRSLYVRPLREFWPVGLLGDVWWLLFVAAGLAALAAPRSPREGAFRVVALGWIGYTILSILILHPEPRYMFALWLFLALYGGWLLGNPAAALRAFWQGGATGRLLAGLALVLVASLLSLCFSAHNYPQLIAAGLQREWQLAAGNRAYAADDFAAAERAYRAALEQRPDFVETRTLLGLSLLYQGEEAAARAVLTGDSAQRLDMARAALARAQGDDERAAALFTQAEIRASADIQTLAFAVLRPPPTDHVRLGTGTDLGYIAGFSPGETTAATATHPAQPYRWLEGRGQVVLPLARPLGAGSGLALRLAAGRPEGTTLHVGFADGTTSTLHVDGTGWRVYHLPVPHALAGQQQLAVRLWGDTFMPAHRFPGSSDLRLLSVMVSEVQVR